MGQVASRVFSSGASKRKERSPSPAPPSGKRQRSGDGAETSAAKVQRASADRSAAASESPVRRRDRAPASPSPSPRGAPSVPPYATSADLLVGHYGTDYLIKDAPGGCKQLGRALYAARPFAAGELVARFSGQTLHADGIMAWRSCSHMLRCPGSDMVIDGHKLAQALVRVPGERGSWKPSGKGRWGDPALGFACMANSAPKQVASAAVRFVCDDTGEGVRPAGFVPSPGGCKLNNEAVRVLPSAAYLVARRDLRPGEEITWHYQVALR